MTRTIVITGVSKGLGRAMLEGFIKAGHTVWGCARSEEAIAHLQSTYDPPHQFSSVDVSDARQVDEWAKDVSRHGVPDLIINNAALINQPAPLWEVPAEEFKQLVDVNITGTANVIRAFVPMMLTARKGLIINFSSGWGRSTSPEVAPYCASKWAIEGLTQALAQELPRGMGAIALNPGIINTDMLKICFGDSASAYSSIQDWQQQAVPFILGFTSKDNGSSLTVPSP
ncbi:MAG: SDR family NAD(P)-dependent oxidoreductase, partial [Leptolyngbyaceae bacterium]|nr:SDR family NAD(P)-dependent oxidoreductase [Leptolyngbyaceae bacterium]